MQIEVWFANGKYIDVRLFDNKTTAKWFNFFSKLNLLNYYRIEVPNQVLQDPAVNINEQWDIILNAIEILKSLGYNFPYEISPKFNYSQPTLNLLHRFFTYNAAWYHNNTNDLSIPNPFDDTFVLPKGMSYIQWFDIINAINVSVHKIENATIPSDNKKLMIEKFPLVSAYVCPCDGTDEDTWLSFTEEDQQHNYTYFNHDGPLVILDNSILGKCVLQSFYEDDDVNAADCSGKIGSHGGFFMDLNDNRKKIYQSQQFKNWTEKHNRSIDSLPLEFPIGYIANYDDVVSWCRWDRWDSRDLSFTKIVFVENDNK